MPKRQGGLNVTVNEFALMNDLVTHYQLLNFVNLWVTEWNKKDSTPQECSCFIVLVILAVSYLQWFFLGVRISKHEKNKFSRFLSMCMICELVSIIYLCACVQYLNFLGISVRLCYFFFSHLNSPYFTYIWGGWVRKQKEGRQQWLEIRPGR